VVERDRVRRVWPAARGSVKMPSTRYPSVISGSVSGRVPTGRPSRVTSSTSSRVLTVIRAAGPLATTGVSSGKVRSARAVASLCVPASTTDSHTRTW
jgi:hypothetical protein